MFTIDTGTPARNLCSFDRPDLMMQAAMDGLPDDATQAQIDGRLVTLILGELRSPRTLATVRRRLLQLWPVIAPLADRDPASFDAILMEFAEQTTVLS